MDGYYGAQCCLHTSKRMHFIEETTTAPPHRGTAACIRQNVCTSLRILTDCRSRTAYTLHTSKRMHFIEDSSSVSNTSTPIALAYVKTYALH